MAKKPSGANAEKPAKPKPDSSTLAPCDASEHSEADRSQADDPFAGGDAWKQPFHLRFWLYTVAGLLLSGAWA